MHAAIARPRLVVELSTEALLGVLAFAASLGAALFWLGHMRADVERAKQDVAFLRQETAELKIQVGILLTSHLRRETLPEAVKAAGEPEEEVTD